MRKLHGYIGIAITAICAIYLFTPAESSIFFHSQNVKITALDRLPSSQIVRALDPNYDVYNSAQKYSACQLTSKACEIVFKNFERSHELLLNESQEFQNYSYEQYIKKNDSLDAQFLSKLAEAAVSHATPKIRSRIAAEIYTVNFFALILLVAFIFLRREIGKTAIYPIHLAYKLTLATARKAHEKI